MTIVYLLGVYIQVVFRHASYNALDGPIKKANQKTISTACSCCSLDVMLMTTKKLKVIYTHTLAET